MSPEFIKGIKTHLCSVPPEGEGTTAGHEPQIVFDRYHVVAKANDAVDTVWRAEAKTRPELKRSRYT